MVESCLNIASLSATFQEDLNSIENEYFNFQSVEDVDISSNSSVSGNSDSESDDSIQELVENNLREVEWSEADKEEKARISDFLKKGCNCQFGPDKNSCSEKLSEEELLDSRAACFELSQSELDMVILSQLQAYIRRNLANSRKRYKTSYSYQGKVNPDNVIA